MNDPQLDLTVLLRAWQAGEATAFHTVFPSIYEQLRRQASNLYFHNPSATLQPTALVHEAYLRLAEQKLHWENREHFFAVAAVIMRRILVDAARSRTRDKRGGGATHVQIDEALSVADEKGIDLLALDDALEVLTQIDPRQARIVELRFFGGLTETQTAAVLDVSPKTVQRGWALARAWLQKYMSAHSDT